MNYVIFIFSSFWALGSLILIRPPQGEELNEDYSHLLDR